MTALPHTTYFEKTLLGLNFITFFSNYHYMASTIMQVYMSKWPCPPCHLRRTIVQYNQLAPVLTPLQFTMYVLTCILMPIVLLTCFYMYIYTHTHTCTHTHGMHAHTHAHYTHTTYTSYTP